MVRIKDRILGTPEGKIGNMVYRTINGKTFASQRPPKYNASQSAAAKSNRERFGIAIQFSKYVNSIPELSKIWKHAKLKGATSFNKIVKYNIKFINNNSLTVHNIIIPDSNTNNDLVDIKNFMLDHTSIKLNMDLFDKVNALQLTYPLILFAVMVFQEPKTRNKTSITVTHLSKDITSLLNNKPVSLELKLTGSQKNLSSKYKTCITYLVLILDSPLPKKVVYTPTYAKLFNLLEVKKVKAL